MRTSPSKALLLAAAFTLTATINASAYAHSLREVVQETVSTNPDVQITAKVKRASNEQVKQARAGYFPTLNVNAAYGRERSNNTLNLAGEHTTRSNLWRRELGVELRQNVFRGFDTWYDVKRTKAKTDADSYLVCAAAEDQALLATQAYISVLRDRELVRIARHNLDSHQSYHSMIKQRGQSGVGREGDIYEVDGRLALARANLAAVENELANSEAMYYRVTGLHATDLEMPAVPGGRFIPGSLDEATQLALRYHPKMRSAVVDVEEARAQHNETFRTAFPVLDIVAAAQDDRNVDGVEGPNKSVSLMGEFHYNLFNGGADIARQRETAYLTQEAAEVRNRTCRQVVENMRFAWNAMETSARRIPSLREHARASHESLGVFSQQFKLSKRSLLDVLDMENERFAAESDFARGRYDELFSRYRVVDAMGQLSNYLKIRLPHEAAEVYSTYEDIAGPARSNRQYDAGLEQRDFPSKLYHTHEPVLTHRPYVSHSNPEVMHDFAHEQIQRVFAFERKPSAFTETSNAHGQRKVTKESSKKVAAKSESGKSHTTKQVLNKSKKLTHKAKSKLPAKQASATTTNSVANPTHEVHSTADNAVVQQLAANQATAQQTQQLQANPDEHAQQQSSRFAPNQSDAQQQSSRIASSQADSQQANFSENAQQQSPGQAANNSADAQQQSPRQAANNPADAQHSPQAADHQANADEHAQKTAASNQAASQENATETALKQQYPRAAQDNASANQHSQSTQNEQQNPQINADQASQQKLPQSDNHGAANNTEQSAAAETPKQWAVKVGSFTSDEDVKKSIATLQSNGFNGFVKEIKTANNTTTEVYAGPTRQRSAAEKLYNQLKQSNIEGAVVSTEYNGEA